MISPILTIFRSRGDMSDRRLTSRRSLRSRQASRSNYGQSRQPYLARAYRRRHGARWKRTAFWAIAWISLSVMLGGCVDVEAGIQFWDANHGAIVQTVRLDGSLAALTTGGEQVWFDGLVERSRQLGGKTIERSPGIVTVKIPFNNGQDLTEKFNDLLSASASYSPLAEGATPLATRFSLQQRNFGLAVRNHLEYDLDLRSLQGWSLDTDNDSIKLSILPRQGFNATFEVAGPRRLSVVSGEGGEHHGNQWQWPLRSGQANHISVDFWVPSYIGLGALFIAGLVSIGWWTYPQ
ncbi:MAG: DUF3153 domain-containing protein [Cyanobacteria bacterium P01_D01_bin.73]